MADSRVILCFAIFICFVGRGTAANRAPPPPRDASCKDSSKFCSDWARKGECTKNPVNMKANCKLSCGLCGGGGKAVFSVGGNAQGGRRGSATEGDACNRITQVPAHLTFITRYRYYYKYTHAYGIPIISSNNVRNEALKRACYLMRFLLADQKVLRQALYKNYGRMGIIAESEGTLSIPEHRWLGGNWNARARGLGGTVAIPISTGGEENLLCYRNNRDRYPNEDIFLHEFSHAILLIAVTNGMRGHYQRVQRAFRNARYRGLWRGTYSMSTVEEYWAEGVQSFFNVNSYKAVPNGIHGPISTRSKLYKYDRTLYNLVYQVFPCANTIWKRCDAARRTAMPQFKMNCRGGNQKTIGIKGGNFVTVSGKKTKGGKKKGGKKKGGKKPLPPPPKPKPSGKCSNKNVYCASWANRGYCKRGHTYYTFMKKDCRKSCNFCSNANCKNKNKNCGFWSGKGFCTSNASWMTPNCKKSCNKC